MSSDVVIKIENVSKCFEVYDAPRDRLKQFFLPSIQEMLRKKPNRYYREFWALKDVSFEVKKGETVGIVGRNGSGKSTLLQIICGTLAQTHGSVMANGRIAALLELGSGFNPDFTGRENVYMNASVLGLGKEEIDACFDEIASFADIGNFLEQPVKTYSSGMVVRLAFSVAINVAPDILIVDEALAVGDAAFQRKCLRKIDEISSGGTTLLFVSHDLETVRKICESAVYLNGGAMIGFGRAKDVCIGYERDLFGASRKSEYSRPGPSVGESREDSAIFDPELAGEGEKIYGDGRAEIFDVAIFNGQRKKINVLQLNSDVVVSYCVKFLDRVETPIFGMLMTNREGISIFGVNTTGQDISRRVFLENNEVRIDFCLKNHLAPGIYYLTCGVHAPDAGEGLMYLHRRMDVLVFKVVAGDGLRIGGVANLDPKIEVVECAS